MKFKLAFAAILLLFITVQRADAQSYIETYSTAGKSFSIRADHQDDNAIKVTVKDISDKLVVEYKVWTNNMEIFANTFEQRFRDSVSFADSIKTAERLNWLAYGRELFSKYTTSLLNTRPPAGVFALKDSITLYKVYLDSKGRRQYAATTTRYKIARLQAEISDGYIENIIVYVANRKGNTVLYTLPYPIGMSSVNNFKKYAKRELFPLSTSPFSFNKKDPSDTAKFYIHLGDAIDYDYFLGVKRRDYSPKDTALDIQGGVSLTLHKEETKKLFEAHIFTDFVGLNETKPNGLVQTEINKRINLNTVQYRSGKGTYWLFKSYGFFQYINPSVTISKFEQHNKRLILSDLDSVRLNPGTTDTSRFDKNYSRYSDILSLYQYQWASLGVDMNLFFINNHDLKFTVFFNTGVRLGMTQVTDSLTTVTPASVTKTGMVNEYTLNSIQVMPEIRMNFLPEERFNFSISHRWLNNIPLNPAVQFANYDKHDRNKIVPRAHNWLNISELLLTVKTNPVTDSKVFARARFNWESGNSKYNFAQVQVGFSTFILSGK